MARYRYNAQVSLKHTPFPPFHMQTSLEESRKLSRSSVTFDKKKEWHIDDIARQDLQNKQNKKYIL